MQEALTKQQFVCCLAESILNDVLRRGNAPDEKKDHCMAHQQNQNPRRFHQTSALVPVTPPHTVDAELVNTGEHAALEGRGGLQDEQARHATTSITMSII